MVLQSDRPDICNKNLPHEMEFEPFDHFPDISSKYRRVPLVPDFDQYVGRQPEKDEQKLAENNQKQDIDPNKDYVLKPLNRVFAEWSKYQSREGRERHLAHDFFNPAIYKPDLMQYHDKSNRAKDYIKQTFERSKLSPNLRFDNSPARDNKMY